MNPRELRFIVLAVSYQGSYFFDDKLVHPAKVDLSQNYFSRLIEGHFIYDFRLPLVLLYYAISLRVENKNKKNGIFQLLEMPQNA